MISLIKITTKIHFGILNKIDKLATNKIRNANRVDGSASCR